MGLFLPLVIYTSAKGRNGNDPTTSYNIAKRNFLMIAKTKIEKFYKHLENENEASPKVYNLGYEGDRVLFESDLHNRPRLNAISRKCTIIAAEPGDLLRRFQDGSSGHEFERVAEAISGTPVFFVPDFKFSGYKNQLDKFAPEIADTGRYFMSHVFDGEEYKSFSLDKLESAENKLIDFTMESFVHLKNKIMGMQKVAR